MFLGKSKVMVIFYSASAVLTKKEIAQVESIYRKGETPIIKNGSVISQTSPDYPVCGSIPEQYLTPKGNLIKGIKRYKLDDVEDDEEKEEDESNVDDKTE